MQKHTANLILKSIGLIGVLLVTYFTKNPNCLWAILLVMYLEVDN